MIQLIKPRYSAKKKNCKTHQIFIEMEAIIKNKKMRNNPFIIFLPFLIIYIIVILIFAKTEFTGDEDRYIMYAKNLTHGFYTLPSPYLDLGNGPGYSMLLTPFVALKLPLIFIKLNY